AGESDLTPRGPTPARCCRGERGQRRRTTQGGTVPHRHGSALAYSERMSTGREGGDGGPSTSRVPRLTPALVVVGFVTVVAALAAGTAGGWQLEPRVWFEGQGLSGERTPLLMQQPTPPPLVSEAGPLQQRIAGIV